jgi:hypothetical protein
VEFVLELKGEPEIVVESWIVGSALQSGLKFRNCSHEVGFLKIGRAEIPLVAGIGRSQTQRLAKSNDCAVTISTLQERESQVIWSIGIGGLETNELTKRNRCFLGRPARCKSNPNWFCASGWSGLTFTDACRAAMAPSASPRLLHARPK